MVTVNIILVTETSQLVKFAFASLVSDIIMVGNGRTHRHTDRQTDNRDRLF